MSVVTVTTQRVVVIDGVIVRRLATVGTQGPPGAPAIPNGGTTGQPLAKLSNTNLDANWANQIEVDEVRLRTTPNAALSDAIGSLYWDDLDQALAYRTDGLNVDIGQENLVYVRNPAGEATIPKGAAVAVKGASSNRLEVQLCDATAGANVGCRTIGVALGPIASPGFGFVSTFGLVRGFNTGNIIGGGVTEGGELFISSTPGVLSTQPQASPGRRVTVGYVVTTGTNGSIFVTIRRGLTFFELDNVQSSGFTANDLARYNGSVFVPVRITADME